MEAGQSMRDARKDSYRRPGEANGLSCFGVEGFMVLRGLRG